MNGTANKFLIVMALVGATGFITPAAFGQGRGGRGGGRGAATPAQPQEDGIPVTDALTISKCASCHAKDDKGNLTRISWIRTTPEGWEEAIKRMIRLNGLTLEPADAKAIVKYLSTSHGLAPEEAKPVMYMTEHRIQDEAIPNESFKSTCNNCHALGRALQWHRTRSAETVRGAAGQPQRRAAGAEAERRRAAKKPPQRQLRR